MQFRLLNLFAILSLAAIFPAAATASTAAISFVWTAVMFSVVCANRLRHIPRQQLSTYIVEELVAMVFVMFWGVVVGLVLGMPLYLLTRWPREPSQAIACGVSALLAAHVACPTLLPKLG